jgi:ABC-type nitrate/sulfonate/bicarbonate transport system substrate-binding protein
MSGSSGIGRVSVLLDYYPSAQFAGLHLANRLGLYRSRGLDLALLPPPGAGGDEPQLVCNLQKAFDKEGAAAAVPRLAVGTVEQNVLIPAVARGVGAKAFATTFQSSPLALAALPGTKLSSVRDLCGLRLGMHVDSMELMTSLVTISGFSASVVEVERANKVQDLVDGKVDAIQIYDCMEAIEIRHLLQQAPNVLRLTDIATGAQARAGRTIPLGYSQVLFGAKWALRTPAARTTLTAFLEATSEGWLHAQAEPGAAVEAILADRRDLGAARGGLVDSVVFQEEALLRALPYVLPKGADTRKVGVIDPAVWREASYAMGAIICTRSRALIHTREMCARSVLARSSLSPGLP